MAKPIATMEIPVVSAETFVELEFEEKYIYYAQKFGHAGTELETRQPYVEQDFFRDVNPIVTMQVANPDYGKPNAPANTPAEIDVTGRLKDLDSERYKSKLQMAVRSYDTYTRQKKELCNDLMLHLDKSLRAAVTQHKDYAAAKRADDIITLWDIVVDSATGKGAHSVYVLMMRFLNVKMKGTSPSDFTDYVKKYNDIVADMTKIGTAQVIYDTLINAKFVEGLNAEVFVDQIRNIMGQSVWPQYRTLQEELTRYMNASKGIAGTIMRKDNPEGVQVNVGKISDFKGTCYNCGAYPAKHRAAECNKPKHKCNICGHYGHLEDYCLNNPANKRQGKGQADERKQVNDSKPPAKAAGQRFTKGDRKKIMKTIRVKRTQVIDDDGNEQEVLLQVEDDEKEEEEYEDEDAQSIMVLGRTAVKFTSGDKKINPNTLIDCNVMKMDTEEQVLFAVDSGCIGGGHVVNDMSILKHTENAQVTVQGYDGKQTIVDKAGHVPGIGRAVYVPDAPNNLINLRKLCEDIGGTYHGDATQMSIYDAKGDIYATARDHGDGFLSVSMADLPIVTATLTQRTPDQFTPEETTRAKEAYEMCARMGHPGFRSLQASLDSGAYGPTHLTSQDVRNGRALYGKCLPCLEAKMKRNDATASQTQPANKVGETIFMDIIPYPGCKTQPAIGGFMGAVFAVDEKSGYTMVCGIKSKSEVLEAMQSIIAAFNSHQHVVKRVVTDDESSFTAHIKPLAKLGIQLSSTPAGLHNKRVERYIQTFKQRRSALLATLAYRLPEGKLEHELAIATVRGMNTSCNAVSSKRTPYEVFTGMKPIVPRHVFGQPGISYNPSSTGAHGQWCIYLGLRDNIHHNNIRVYVPSTGTVCSRLKFEPTNTYPAEWGFVARLQPKPKGVQPPVQLSPPTPSANWEPKLNPPMNVDVQTGIAVPPTTMTTNTDPVEPQRTVQPGPQGPQILPPAAPTVTTDIQRDRHGGDASVVEQNNMPLPLTVPKPVEAPKAPETVPQATKAPETVPQAQEGAARPKRATAQRLDYGTLSKTGRRIITNRISLQQAWQDETRLKDTKEAARKEITHLFTVLEALEPVRYSDIKLEHKKAIINGHLFFKDKFAADGTYMGRKARLVMNGNEELPENLGETRSPTVNPTSIFAALAIAANNQTTTISAYDAVSAFPTTDITPGKVIIVRIRSTLSGIFLQHYPELKKYKDANGSLYFYLKKFVYGLAEAARAFYDRVDRTLTELGFRKSMADEGLFLKVTGRHVHVVCVHVDDILSIAPNNEAKQDLEKGLRKAFEIKVQDGNNLSYLGMMIERNGDGIRVSQRGYAEDIVKRFANGLSPAKIPASQTLFNAQEAEPYQDKTNYLSIVMSLMYMARLTRPDILLPVAYLATKSQNPTLGHKKQLDQVLQYIKGTISAGLMFKRSDLRLTLSADASHLTHADGKGHTGICILLGGTVIACRSTKQKVQARSSTEAEIIAAEEAITYIPFIMNILKDMGVEHPTPVTMQQDNKSAIFLYVQGGQFSRIKHMLQRISYLRDAVANKLVKPVYTATTDIVADALTKPMNKQQLEKHSRQMGMQSE